MSDPQHGPVGEDDLRTLLARTNADENYIAAPSLVARAEARISQIHQEIVDDESEDEDMMSGVSNHAKKLFICKHTRTDPDSFDLAHSFPVIEWAISNDAIKLKCGLYLSILRQRYFNVLRDQAEGRIQSFEQWHANAEFWADRFEEQFSLLSTGTFTRKRVLH